MCALSEMWVNQLGVQPDRQASNEKREHGINVDFCIENASFMKDNLPNVNKRFLIAAGKLQYFTSLRS